ncbi:uncharacterized protein LOC129947453 [Eupeodes corollae]|uniref:uncharacterized protein LOC129947453 n=1 Tax=Eupeodes corollae TaxID=290404 RepID=UPI0024915749|nr:uncharacterized protein LOC129947453 [Eupeodes corollae]
MTKRNLWGYEETLTLISIIEEKECLQKLEEKKYKTNQIYQLIEQEMFARGYYDKNAKQMEFRWQNLKKIFYKDRKTIEAGDKDHKVSPYYDQVEAVLSNRTKVKKKENVEMSTLSVNPINTIDNGHFSTDEDEERVIEHDIELDLPKTEMPTFEECFPSLPTPKPRIDLKRPREIDSVSKIDAFQEKIKKVTRELNEDLFRKQKELIEYEFRLFANYTTGRDEKFKDIMSQNTQTFLSGIRDLLQENNNNSKVKSINHPKSRLSEARQVESIEDHNIKQFFQSWDQEANRK